MSRLLSSQIYPTKVHELDLLPPGIFETVLRLKDWRRLAAGAPSNVERIRHCTGLSVEHDTILREQPEVPV